MQAHKTEHEADRKKAGENECDIVTVSYCLLLQAGSSQNGLYLNYYAISIKKVTSLP